MKRTILYEEHLKLGARMVEFGGWEMPLQYPGGIFAEHLATRKSGGLFDISHMGRFLVSGKGALPFLQYVLTSNVAALAPGRSQYTIIPDENGGAVDDAYLYRMNEKDYLLVVNAANLEKDRAWLQKYQSKFPGVTLEDHTDRIAMLSLQGPGTKTVLATTAGNSGKLPEPGRNNLATVEMLGAPVSIARTGYTGEPVGFELFPPARIAVELWRRLLERGEKKGIVPVGLGARDTLRLEAGLPLYGHELGSDAEGKEIPIFALPVARIAVSFARIKGDFIGREALLEQSREIKLRQEGQLDTPEERLSVPRIIFPVAVYNGVARAGCQVYRDGKPAGSVTSGTVVPYWKTEGAGLGSRPGTESGRRAICLAYLDAKLKEGKRVRIAIRDRTAEGIIVERHIGSEAAPYTYPILTEEQANVQAGRA